jgi:plastocyanin
MKERSPSFQVAARFGRDHHRNERRFVMKKGILVSTVVVAALVLAACGGGEEGGAAAGGTSAEAGATSLSMVDNAFEPSSLSVAAGATVEVSNDGESPHNITIEGQGIDEDVEAGQSTSVTFDLEPGDYIMFCEFHRGAGMEGTLTVS